MLRMSEFSRPRNAPLDFQVHDHFRDLAKMVGIRTVHRSNRYALQSLPDERKTKALRTRNQFRHIQEIATIAPSVRGRARSFWFRSVPSLHSSPPHLPLRASHSVDKSSVQTRHPTDENRIGNSDLYGFHFPYCRIHTLLENRFSSSHFVRGFWSDRPRTLAKKA